MSEKRVAQYIRNWRKQHDLSQQELADELNISRQSLIALEQGKYMPSLNLAVSMCDFFNAAFEEVFDIGSRAQEMIKEAGEDINKKINIRKGVNDMTREIGSWDPFREGVTLRDAMDRLFEDSVVAAPARMAMKVPKIDVMQKGNDIIVKAELPGIDEDKIDIDVAEDSITISGEKSEEKETKREDYYHKESFAGSFSRNIALPAQVKPDKANAEMRNGILVVTLPKAEEKKSKKIKLSSKK